MEKETRQVINVQLRKRGFSGRSSGQSDISDPPKFGKGAGGARLSGMSRGTPSRGGPVGRGQQRSASQGSSASVSRVLVNSVGNQTILRITVGRRKGNAWAVRVRSTKLQVVQFYLERQE